MNFDEEVSAVSTSRVLRPAYVALVYCACFLISSSIVLTVLGFANPSALSVSFLIIAFCAYGLPGAALVGVIAFIIRSARLAGSIISTALLVFLIIGALTFVAAVFFALTGDHGAAIAGAFMMNVFVLSPVIFAGALVSFAAAFVESLLLKTHS